MLWVLLLPLKHIRSLPRIALQTIIDMSNIRQPYNMDRIRTSGDVKATNAGDLPAA